MKTIWNKETGEAAAYESVDAREILANSPDLYTDQDPNGGDATDPDGDGREAAPQNVANVENEFRREPVGDDPPGPERVGTIIRNAVTDVPRMAADPDTGRLAGDDSDSPPKTSGASPVDRMNAKRDLDGMTVAELREHAETNKIDLGDATRKDDIRAAIDKAQAA